VTPAILEDNWSMGTSRTISLPEEFVSAALTEQFAGDEYFRRRAHRFTPEKFRAALDQIPDAEPQPHDRIP
jgi:hypothetical protein